MAGTAGAAYLPRLLTKPLERALAAFPVVVVTGARQTGKTTLVQRVGAERTYLTLDDLDVLEQAVSAPDDLLRRGGHLTLDEVQRSPDLLLAVKRVVDRDRRPGRFLLTGSANLLLSRRIAETLAGRATYLTLWPLTLGELEGDGRAGRWTSLLSRPPRDWLAVLNPHPTLRDARHLRSFIDEYAGAAHGALLLHTGVTTEWLSERVLSVPWWRVL